MSTATIGNISEHKERRSSLQRQLKRAPELWKAREKSLTELKLAQNLVASFDRPQGYEARFEREFATAAKAHSDCEAKIPNQLINTCQDPDLRSQYEACVAFKAALVTQVTDARRDLFLADESRRTIISRISQRLGKPAMLLPGQSPQWSQGIIQRAAGLVFATDEQDVKWAIREDEILFSPEVDESNAKHYLASWRDCMTWQRRSRMVLESIEAELLEADQRRDEIKAKMIASPI